MKLLKDISKDLEKHFFKDRFYSKPLEKIYCKIFGK